MQSIKPRRLKRSNQLGVAYSSKAVTLALRQLPCLAVVVTSAVNKPWTLMTSWKSQISYQKIKTCKMKMTTTEMRLKMKKQRKKERMKRPAKKTKMRAWPMSRVPEQRVKGSPLRAVTMKEEDGLDD